MEFKRYLQGVCDAGTRLLFKFRSGTHGLNEELGRHSNRDGKKECDLCGDECESVSHVLWECPAYCDIRSDFLEAFNDSLGETYESFESLDRMGKSAFVLGSELWEESFEELLKLVKHFVVAIWETRKFKLYGSTDELQSQSQVSSGELQLTAGVTGYGGKFGSQCGKADHSCLSDCNSARVYGCAVDGDNAMA